MGGGRFGKGKKSSRERTVGWGMLHEGDGTGMAWEGELPASAEGTGARGEEGQHREGKCGREECLGVGHKGTGGNKGRRGQGGGEREELRRNVETGGLKEWAGGHAL